MESPSGCVNKQMLTLPRFVIQEIHDRLERRNCGAQLLIVYILLHNFLWVYLGIVSSGLSPQYENSHFGYYTVKSSLEFPNASDLFLWILGGFNDVESENQSLANPLPRCYIAIAWAVFLL